MTDESSAAKQLAAEFVLADADGDVAKAQELLERVSAGEVSGTGVLVTLARMVAEISSIAFGARWRDDMNLALLRLSMEKIEADDGE